MFKPIYFKATTNTGREVIINLSAVHYFYNSNVNNTHEDQEKGITVEFENSFLRLVDVSFEDLEKLIEKSL